MYKEGSFNMYLHTSGGFVTTMAKAIQKADRNNIFRIRKSFPQMVASWECSSWNDVPKDYEPFYNGEKIYEFTEI